MNSTIASVTVAREGYPVLWVLTSFPIACFTCALLTDIAYAQTANMMWTDFSAWLLAVGMASGVIAAIAGLVSWRSSRRSGGSRSVWIIALGSLLTLIIAFINNLVHSRDAWTSVVPTGLMLSVATVIVLLATAWFASGASRRRVAATS